jgi:DNA-binding PadR family transcriptional regulator
LSRPERELTTTSYAILGLLAIRPWSTYELAQQMRRNLHYFWPRAESNLYAEPKRLVEGGFAAALSQPVGQRRRTVYSITPSGRTALARWIAQPASESRLESETLVKIMFAPYGSKGELDGHLRRFLDELRERQQHLRTIFEEYLSGADPFPERVHINVLCYRLIWDYTETAADWADWAINQVDSWPNVTAPTDRPALIESLARALGEAAPQRAHKATSSSDDPE